MKREKESVRERVSESESGIVWRKKCVRERERMTLGDRELVKE